MASCDTPCRQQAQGPPRVAAISRRCAQQSDGYVLVTKRLEKGTVKTPWSVERGRVIIEAAELLLMLEGIDLEGAKRRARWSPHARVA